MEVEKIMKRILSAAMAASAAALIFAAGPVQAQDYAPEDGDSVVLYISKFKKGDFDRAQDIMMKGFGKAMKASGQTRLTYWTADPETGEIIAISFFKKGHTVGKWHDDSGRQKVLDQLKPLRTQPQQAKHLKVIGSHATAK